MVTSVRLPEELERSVLAYAERHDVSKSTAMRLLMENGLARQDLPRDVTELENRLTAMEGTLTEISAALEQLQGSHSEPTPGDREPPAIDRNDSSGDAPSEVTEPTGITTIPGGPDAPPDGSESPSEESTEQAGIGQWNTGDPATPEEVTDGGQPTGPPPGDQS